MSYELILHDPETGHTIIVQNALVIKALELAYEQHPEAMNDMLVAFVKMHPENTDAEISHILTEFILSEMEMAATFQLVTRDMHQIMLSMLGAKKDATKKRCRPHKVRIPYKDYTPLLPSLIREVRSLWIGSISNMSTDSLKNLRRKLRTIKTYHENNKEAERIYRKLESFMAELKSVVKRFESARNKSTAFTPIHQSPLRKTLKEAPPSNKMRLLSDIREIVNLPQGHIATEFSNTKLENLLSILKYLEGNSMAQAELLAIPRLRIFLSNHSPLMHAASLDSLVEVLRIIHNMPRELSDSNYTANVEWEKYTLPENTSIKLILRDCVSKSHIIAAIATLNPSTVEIIDSINLRSVDAALASTALVIIAKGLISHKVTMRTSWDMPNVILIDQANPSTLRRRIVEACLTKGFPLIKKP